MKQIEAFVHQVRAAAIVDALTDAGFRNVTHQDVRGMLRPLTDRERDYSSDAAGMVISEARLSLVVDDSEVDAVTAIVCTIGRVGPGISGYVHVSPVDLVLAIGEPD